MADFEREEARPWKEWMENALPSQASKRPARPVVFPTEPETDARASWRRNDEPPGVIELPPEVHSREQILLKGRGRGTGDALLDRFPELREISGNTNTHISLRPIQPRDRGLCLQLWGDQNDVDEAKEQINNWLKDYYGIQKGSKWAKTLNEAQKAQRELEFAESIRAQEFRKAPPVGVTFEYNGTFRWPADMVPVEQFLGRSLEALDPIRSGERCYITYDQAGGTFSMLSTKGERVQQALTRVRAVYFQLAAWQIQAPDLYLVMPPVGTQQWQRVALCNEINSNTDTAMIEGILPKKCLSRLKFDPQEQIISDEESKRWQDLNVRKLKEAIMYTLQKLLYYRGNLTMRARLGTFLLTQYQRQTKYSRTEFMEMMGDEQVRGEVTDQLFLTQFADGSEPEKQRDQAPESMDNCANIFPDEAMRHHIATLLVQKGTEWFKLEADFAGDAEKDVVCTSKKWSRVEPETGNFFNLLDASLIEVENGTAWRFEITAGHPVDDKTSIVLNRFADAVDMHYFKDEELPRFSYKPVVGVLLKNFQHRVAWDYAVERGNYIIELSRILDVNRPVMQGHTKPKDRQNQHYRAGWSVAVFGRDWSRNLDQNAHIGVGEKADWSADFKLFFPHPSEKDPNKSDNSDGLDIFMETLESAEQLVRSKLRSEC